MPFTHSFQRDPSTFVLLRAIGEVSLVMWSNAMRQVIADRVFHETMPVLLDVTEASNAALQPDETLVIARVWRLIAPHSLGAIVARDGEMFGLARQIEQQSDEHVRAFTDLRAAVQWLNNSRNPGA